MSNLLSVEEYAKAILKKGLSYAHSPETLDLNEAALKKKILGVKPEDEIALMRELLTLTKTKSKAKQKGEVAQPGAETQDEDEEVEELRPEQALLHLINFCSTYNNKSVDHDACGTVHFDKPEFSKPGYFTGSSIQKLIKLETALYPKKNGLTKRFIVPYRVVQVTDNPDYLEELRRFNEEMQAWENQEAGPKKKKPKAPAFKPKNPEKKVVTLKVTSVAERLLEDPERERFIRDLGCEIATPEKISQLQPKTSVSSQILWPTTENGKTSYQNLYLVLDGTIDFELKRRANVAEASELQAFFIKQKIDDGFRIDVKKRPKAITTSLPSCTSNVINGGILAASANGMRARFLTDFPRSNKKTTRGLLAKEFFSGDEFIQASKYLKSVAATFRLIEDNKKMKDTWALLGALAAKEFKRNLKAITEEKLSKSVQGPSQVRQSSGAYSGQILH